jgi:long-subunit fatty acid transport protein
MKYPFSLFLFSSLISLISFQVQGTGFNFWESSTLNSALANANGAKARDASVQAMVPASITQLNNTMITASVTHYGVDTDYKIFGKETHYSVANPIPSGFLSTPINDNWSFGLGIYSRAAADINVPSIVLVHPNETRLQPITVSVAPTIAYKIGDISLAITGEHLLSQHQLHQTKCLLNNCKTDIETGDTTGKSGAVSATWQVNSSLSISLMHRLKAQFGNPEINYSLPAISSVYASVTLMDNLYWDLNYSYSRWEGEGIEFTNYTDVLGLLIGFQDSKRYATALEYKINHWFLRAGYSSDEAIDMQGGYDQRYRLGSGYQITPNMAVNITAFKEDYAIKEYNTPDFTLVSVKNKGKGFSLGINYQF